MVLHFDSKTLMVIGTQRGFEATPDLISYPTMKEGDFIETIVMDVKHEEIFEKELADIHSYCIELDDEGNFIGFRLATEADRPNYNKGV